ncbi:MULTISPECIES: biotin transporter BioY [Ureibacillus]|jgi:biotin transport system substrate-specific component|uniref:Biotin transporter n=1 Tax=Ureibacillus thermosphaericus TaxID=51173 RepID=A0A840PWF4_URETH|nr:biotin transporter BioY [Ureibacillus thermosphaericus]MBB5148508.1 biotin transport system substrate-specific component [Ureibacillus thermosphaericus]NKZ31000.1 biotin transporter BioY [Ureibacillus thermosphaericus]
MRNSQIFSLTLVAIFAALTAIGAFIKIPLPIVPFTMQIIIVFLAGSILGSKRGLQSQLVYIFVGLAGLPVFTQGGGLTYVLQPTFGYLVGFAVGAFIIGYIIERGGEEPSRLRFVVANLVGTFVIYAIGAPYVYFALNFLLDMPTSASTVFMTAFLSTVGVDIVLAIVTGLFARRIYFLLNKKMFNVLEVPK